MVTAHDHRTRVEGCFRCELSADEADNPYQDTMSDHTEGNTEVTLTVVAPRKKVRDGEPLCVHRVRVR